jgi:hypothetical protein
MNVDVLYGDRGHKYRLKTLKIRADFEQKTKSKEVLLFCEQFSQLVCIYYKAILFADCKGILLAPVQRLAISEPAN